MAFSLRVIALAALLGAVGWLIFALVQGPPTAPGGWVVVLAPPVQMLVLAMTLLALGRLLDQVEDLHEKQFPRRRRAPPVDVD